MRAGSKVKTFYMKHISTSKGTMTVFNVADSKKVNGQYETSGYINCVVFKELELTDYVIIKSIVDISIGSYTNKYGQKVMQYKAVVEVEDPADAIQENEDYDNLGEEQAEVVLPF